MRNKNFEKAIWIAVLIDTLVFGILYYNGLVYSKWVIFLPLMILIGAYLVTFMFLGILSLILR